LHREGILIVNFAVLDHQEDAGQRRNGIAVGLALSLALHALLLSTWRGSHPHAASDEAEQRRSIAVWLRPPPPPVAPAEEAPARTERAPLRRAPPRRAHAPAPAPRERRIIALPPSPDAPVVVEPPTPRAVPGPAAPHFDVDAARRFARRIADDPDPARAGTAVGQFPQKPLETETRAARAIASAKRRDCKDGIPGGLLAPLYLMLDKKDSGCKW
jgi:hypothetical protein